MGRSSGRTEISSIELQKARALVNAELSRRLIEKGQGTFASRHEILGVLEEELYEYKSSIHMKESDWRLQEELADIAVGAIFAIACLKQGSTDW